MSLEKLFETKCAESYEQGRREATAIDLGESGYGSCRTAIVAYEFKGLRDLISTIRERRWHRHGDNPGMAYAGTCRPIHIHHHDDGKVAILLCSTLYDV